MTNDNDTPLDPSSDESLQAVDPIPSISPGAPGEVTENIHTKMNPAAEHTVIKKSTTAGG
jgi:hypothetical protein